MKPLVNKCALNACIQQMEASALGMGKTHASVLVPRGDRPWTPMPDAPMVDKSACQLP